MSYHAGPGRLTDAPHRSTRRYAYVEDRDGETDVRVAFQLDGPRRWRCAMDGDMEHPDCSHAFTAAMLLAAEFFGIECVPDHDPLNPDPDAPRVGN